MLWSAIVGRRDSRRRSLGHRRNRQLSRGYGAWVEMAAERAAFLQLLRKGLGFLVNRQVAVGFATWYEQVHGRTPDPLGRALMYFLHRNLARGWVSWHETWSTRKRQAESMRRSLSHLLNRQLSKGYGAWAEMAADRGAYLQLLRKGLSMMVNRPVALGLSAWREREFGVSSDAMARALSYFLTRELSRCGGGWQQGEALLRVVAVRAGRGKAQAEGMATPQGAPARRQDPGVAGRL